MQTAVDHLAAQGIDVHGELVEATEHDAADAIVQRARELDVDIIVLGYQHHHGSPVAEHVIRQHPHCSVLLARPPESYRQRTTFRPLGIAEADAGDRLALGRRFGRRRGRTRRRRCTGQPYPRGRRLIRRPYLDPPGHKRSPTVPPTHTGESHPSRPHTYTRGQAAHGSHPSQISDRKSASPTDPPTCTPTTPTAP